MSGIFLGQWKRRLGRRVLIRDCGQTHVTGIAPTRSGKGANMVIPTLLTWPDSVCVLDLKGENYQRSAGRRKQMGQVVLKFGPTSENSTCFNPFDEIDMRSADRIGDIDNIATSLLDPRGKGTVMDSRLTQHLSQHTTLNQRMEAGAAAAARSAPTTPLTPPSSPPPPSGGGWNGRPSGPPIAPPPSGPNNSGPGGSRAGLSYQPIPGRPGAQTRAQAVDITNLQGGKS
jgi:hypothetical protein